MTSSDDFLRDHIRIIPVTIPTAPRLPGYPDLVDLPTLAVGQADNLKIDTGDFRVWLCRCGVADGMPYEHGVFIETRDESTGGWFTLGNYDGDDPPHGLPGVSAHTFRGEY